MAFVEVLLNTLTSLVNSIVLIVPSLVAAVLVLLIGYIVALIADWVVVQVCTRVKLDKIIAQKTNLYKTVGAFSFTNFLALLAKWYTFILFLPAATNTLSGTMVHLANFLEYVALWIPKLIAGVVIAIAGLMAATYVGLKIRDLRFKSADLLAGAVKAFVVVFTALMALRQVGFDVGVAENSFLILLAGVVLAASVAVGISFGFALQNEAKDIIRAVKKKL